MCEVLFVDIAYINSSLRSVTYMRQWMCSALVHIMACRLFGSHPLSKPGLGHCQLEQIKWNFSQENKIVIYKNAYENIVCGKAAVLSRRD